MVQIKMLKVKALRINSVCSVSNTNNEAWQNALNEVALDPSIKAYQSEIYSLCVDVRSTRSLCHSAQSLWVMAANHSGSWQPITLGHGSQSLWVMAANHSGSWQPITLGHGSQSLWVMAANHSGSWQPITLGHGSQSLWVMAATLQWFLVPWRYNRCPS